MRRHGYDAALLAALLALAAPAAAEFREIAGEAEYGERTALPSDALLEVQLLEIAGEATPVPIASITMRALGAKPFPFRLTFDDAMIDRTKRYALAARIRQGEETLFRTAEATPMFTGLVSGPPKIRMVRAEPTAGWPQPSLSTSDWVLVGMHRGEPSGASPARLLFDEESGVQGTGGCNDFEASFRTDPPKGLSFGKLAATLRGCSPDVAQQERLVFRALAATRHYEIDDEGKLVLLDAEGAPLLTFEQQR